ncbi:MAG: 5'/3'-nucleotidase SurE [candidate division WOR-3 bacterium]|nr:MAG: 5'/3'-nucleotidase SurE [candidate division WOR-3 bacterium]
MALILLTNDDGYDAAGLQALYKALKKDYTVIVVAPSTQQSGASHSLTLRKPIRVEKLHENFYIVGGTPTDCVLLAYHDLIGMKIDLVVSGINHGPNMGSDVFYSGTVAAALQGASMGIKSLAISIAVDADCNFDDAVKYSRDLIGRVLASERNDIILNVNIPSGKIKGEKITRMGKRIYKDKVIRDREKKNVIYSIIDGVLSYRADNNTDFKAIDKHYVSITPLKLDLTDYDIMQNLDEYIGGESR